MHFGKENVIIKVMLTVKLLNIGKAAGFDEIRVEILKALNQRESFWSTFVYQMA